MQGLIGPLSCVLFMLTFGIISLASRYRTCDEGCCLHEYCAYHRICYPKIHCRFGCPDGRCVGQDTPLSDDTPDLPGVQRRPQSTPLKFYVNSGYIYNPLLKNSELNNINADQSSVPKEDQNEAAREATDKHSHSNVATKPEVSFSERAKDVSEGICMPQPPCKPSDYCGMSHSCTMNFNLGYRTCQYNLDIGTTLCYDNKGNPNLIPMV